MALTTEDIADLIVATLRDLGRLKWTDLSSDLQEFTAMPKLLKKDRVQFKTGRGIQWNLLTGNNDQASHVGLMATDNYNKTDVLATATIPWRNSNTNYMIDEREITMNGDPAAQVLDMVKIQRAAAMIALAELLETTFWGSATVTASDTLTPHTIQNYIVRNASTGFNGGNPSGESGVAGVDASQSDWRARFRNWTFQYTNKTKADLVAGLRQAATKTQFKPAVDMATYDKEGGNYGYYTNYDVLEALETIAENQNQNLGKDVASMDGQVLFRRSPVHYVPKLDSDAQDPIYGLNWTALSPCFLRGEYMREAKPRMAPLSHRTQVVDVDLTWNLICYNRRRLFVGNTA